MSAAHRIGAATRVFALLGDPVAHSRSPTFQNAALRYLGLDGVYVALRCSALDAPMLVRALSLAGGGGNVTVPHKAVVLPALDRTTAAVDRTGACNTFWLDDGRVCGDNTDVTGFREALAGLGCFADARVLLLGAGGAASAAAVALLDEGVARIDVLNRTPERAARMSERLGAARLHVLTDPPHAGHVAFDLIVNSTTVGLHDENTPIDDDVLAHTGAVLDLVVRPGGTALVQRATSFGIRATDGTTMLLGQGAAAFRHWWNREPPREVMRAALDDPGAD